MNSPSLDPRDLLNANHTNGNHHIKVEVGTEVRYLHLGENGFYRTNTGEYVRLDKVGTVWAARYDKMEVLDE